MHFVNGNCGLANVVIIVNPVKLIDCCCHSHCLIKQQFIQSIGRTLNKVKMEAESIPFFLRFASLWIVTHVKNHSYCGPPCFMFGYRNHELNEKLSSSKYSWIIMGMHEPHEVTHTNLAPDWNGKLWAENSLKTF